MAELKFEGAAATSKERRIARPARCEPGRLLCLSSIQGGFHMAELKFEGRCSGE